MIFAPPLPPAHSDTRSSQIERQTGGQADGELARRTLASGVAAADVASSADSSSSGGGAADESIADGLKITWLADGGWRNKRAPVRSRARSHLLPLN